MARVLVGAIAILLTSLFVGLTSVSADPPRTAVAQRQNATHIETVTADRVISTVEYPAGSGNCSNYVFYEFSDVPGTQSGTLTYLVDGQEREAGTSPPYDDVYNQPPRHAPEGRHWIYVGYNAYSGPGQGTTECEGSLKEFFETHFSQTGRLLLTVEGPAEDPEACSDAKKRAKKAGEKVKQLQEQLKGGTKGHGTNGPSKEQLQERLKKAKERRADLKEDVHILCQ